VNFDFTGFGGIGIDRFTAVPEPGLGALVIAAPILLGRRTRCRPQKNPGANLLPPLS
jgi:hypothetical protein